MLKNKYLYVPLIISVILFIITEFIRPKPVDWRATFLRKDKIPYGCYILYSQLKDIFPGQTIEINKKSYYRFLKEKTIEKETSLLIIDQQFNPEKLDLDALLDFVSEGNNLFISAQEFGKNLEDTLGFSMGFTNN